MPSPNQTSTVPLPSPPPSDSPVPHITFFTRIGSVPMVSALSQTVSDALNANAYTRSPYCTAKGLSTTALHLTEPLQIRLAPILVRADGFANKAVDVVESRYPYPFKAKPEEVVRYVRERRESAVNVASEAIDKNVKLPVANVAQGIDQRFKPFVNFFEDQVKQVGKLPESSSSEAQYQYQRVYALSMSLTNHIYVLSNEHLKQLHENNALVRRATETAQAITSVASSSLSNAHSRVHVLSDTMIQELQRLQQSTSNLSCSLAATLQSASAHQQATFNELSTALSSAVNELRRIMAQPIPLNDKVTRVRTEVKDRVVPLLGNASRRVNELFDILRGRAEGAKEKSTKGGVNGHAGAQ